MTCDTCSGTGEVTACWDDLCQDPEDGCIHGDNTTCPECLGDGEVAGEDD